MNNIQKSFKTKSMLREMRDEDGDEARCMADGGFIERLKQPLVQPTNPVVKKVADAIGKAYSAGPLTSQPLYHPAVNPPEGSVLRTMQHVGDAIGRAYGLRKADGGKVKGPGGPTDDKVPAMLSHGEYVLPADTVQAIGVDKLDAVKNATHTPVEDMSGATHTMPRRKSALRLADGGQVGFDPTMDPILEMQKRAQQVHAADANFAAQPAPPPRVPVQVNVPANTGYGSVTPTPDELRARVLSNAQRAGLPPYPQEATQATQATQAEFDAARARQLGAPNFQLGEGSANPGFRPPSEPNTLSVEGARAARAARYGEAATGTSKLRAGLSAVGDFVKSPITKATGLAGAGARIAGTAAIPVMAGYQAYSDTPEQRAQASGLADSPEALQHVGQLGSYLGSGLTLGAVSPSDIGNIIDTTGRGISDLRSGGSGTAAFQHVPRDRQGWLTQRVLDATGDNAGDMGTAATTTKPMFIEPNSGQIPDSAMLLSGDQAAKQASDDARMKAISATGGDPNSPYYGKGGKEVVGQFNGKDITRAQSDALAGRIGLAGDPGAANAGATEDPVASALRSMLGNQNSSVGMLNSRAGDINRHFDDLAKEIEKLHGGARFHANGELAGKLLDLEKARAIALGQDQGNLVGSQGNVASDASSLRQQQNNALDGMVQRANNNDTNTASQRNAIIAHQNDALKMRQEQSEKALAEAHAQALAQAPLGPDGKPDQAAAQKIFESLTNNYEPAVDGTPPTVGAAAERLAQASQNQSLRAMANEGSNNPSYQPVKELSNRHSPTFGEFLNHDTNIGLGDVARGVANDLGIPFVDSADVYDTDGSGDKVRARKLTPDQIDHARRQKILRGN